MPNFKYSFSEGELVAGNYRVLSIAGSGGMGVVYRALDLRLQRTVALKFLPPELNISAQDKERFLREARTASSLDHPNIGVIHGVEETPGGLTFIVMAYYEGASLADRLRGGPLPAHESIEIASQIATGLAEAHTRGIVHRDIKPSNIMLTPSGLVKIVDFGLARVASEQTTSQIGIMGTARYMSPEQAMGRPVDKRCDIWALGVVFVEMLTGKSPFHAETMAAMLYAIVNEPPRDVDSTNSALQPILYRALAKDPARRYASCKEFLADLDSATRDIPITARDAADGAETVPATAPGTAKPSAKTRRALADAARAAWHPSVRDRSSLTKWLMGALAALLLAGSVILSVAPVRRRAISLLPGAPTERHVAVLPFDNIGGKPENAALADGLMDSLTGRLSNLDVGGKSLWVVPNSVVRKYSVSDLSTALKKLGANLVVKGSVQKDGSDIHLTVNLIDTKNVRQIGSAEVESRTGNLSTLEDDAVSSLAQIMKISVPAGIVNDTGGSANPAAYEDYITALGYMQRFDKPGNLDLAISLLNRSVKTDPGFALGYAQLGEAYRLKFLVEKDPRWLEDGLANCQKAAKLDNRAPAVLVTLGEIHEALGKHDLALQEFHQALVLDHRNAAAYDGLAQSFKNSGRIADAEKALQDAAALSSEDWYGYNELGVFYEGQGKYTQAIDAFRQALAKTPDNADLYSNIGGAYLDQGGQQSRAPAEQALIKSIDLNPSYPAYANLGLLYLQEKRYAEAASAIEQALKINGNDYMVWNSLTLASQRSNQSAKADMARRKAQQLAEQEVERKPLDATAQSALAAFYAYDKLNEKARTRIRAALALAPEDPNVLTNVGEAYEFLGDRKQALMYIEKALRKGYGLDDLAIDPDLESLLADPRFKPPAK